MQGCCKVPTLIETHSEQTEDEHKQHGDKSTQFIIMINLRHITKLSKAGMEGGAQPVKHYYIQIKRKVGDKKYS